MRLWSLHPSMLDRQGLVTCWREALLAQAVLFGRTRGYTRHPQLERFRSHTYPIRAIGSYLAGVHNESVNRGYRFNADRIASPPQYAHDKTSLDHIDVTYGQLGFEWCHLQTKLSERSPEFLCSQARWLETPEQHLPVHPLFTAVPGDVAIWERGHP